MTCFNTLAFAAPDLLRHMLQYSFTRVPLSSFAIHRTSVTSSTCSVIMTRMSSFALAFAQLGWISRNIPRLFCSVMLTCLFARTTKGRRLSLAVMQYNANVSYYISLNSPSLIFLPCSFPGFIYCWLLGWYVKHQLLVHSLDFKESRRRDQKLNF